MKFIKLFGGLIQKDNRNDVDSIASSIQLQNEFQFNKAELVKGNLFDGDDQLFKECVKKARVYGEYGVGESTRWVFNNTKINIHAVDTSEQWVNDVLSDKRELDRIDIRWINVGAVKDWGVPVNYSMRHNFILYVNSLWDRDEKPDLVLIDGRFRVCCFLNCLLYSDPNTSIIFDDYQDREEYHIVEEFLKPVDFCGRQALFLVSSDFDRESVRRISEQFLMVWD